MARPKLTITYRLGRTGAKYSKQCARCGEPIGPFPSPERACTYASECFTCRHLPKPPRQPTRRPP